MKNKYFSFHPQMWFGNKALRSCSIAARGLWIDILALCCDDGYLTINGRPIDDKALARLIGESLDTLKELMTELGSVGMFHITEDGRLYCPTIIAELRHAQPKKKEISAKHEHELADSQQFIYKTNVITGDITKKECDDFAKSMLRAAVAGDINMREPVKHKTKAPWWKTPSGWAKKGLEQALSPKPDESIEEFKLRVCLQIGDGEHVEALTERNKKRFDAETKKNKEKLANVRM